MDGLSLDITAELLSQLRQLLPDAFSEDKVDMPRLKAALEAADALAPTTEHYELTWAGKADARREVQRQTTATLVPDSARSVDFDTTGNVFIEGENLEVLRVLQRAYFGKVKMIYIDPPYNTGSDAFVYPDDYTERREDYEKRSGLRDEKGFLNKQDLWKKNTKESGQYHSAWLSMMWPRLYLSRNLLREDGVIFVSIDDNEVHNLQPMLNEIFGEENFVGQWNWFKSATPPNLSKKIKKNIEYILCYQKSKNSDKFKGITKFSSSDDPLTKPQNTVKNLTFEPGWLNINAEDGVINPGVYGTGKYPNELLNELVVKDKLNVNQVIFRNKFVWTQTKLEAEIAAGTRMSASKSLVVTYKKAEYGEEVPPNLIDESVGVDTTEKAGSDLTKLFGGVTVFDYPKPVALIKYLSNFCCKSGDLILDYFAGSGTTAQAVMELNAEDGGNRRFLVVQMPEITEETTEAYKAGYHTISAITQARIAKAAAKLKSAEADNLELDGAAPQDFGFRTYKLEYSNFKPWQGDVRAADAVLAQLELFQEPLRDYSDAASAAMLTELLLKAGLPLSARATVADVAGVPVHQVPGTGADSRGLWLALTGISPAVVAAAAAARPTRLVVPGRLFGTADADQTVSNYRLQLDDAGVKLQLI